jgi:hypothetical protein
MTNVFATTDELRQLMVQTRFGGKRKKDKPHIPRLKSFLEDSNKYECERGTNGQVFFYHVSNRDSPFKRKRKKIGWYDVPASHKCRKKIRKCPNPFDLTDIRKPKNYPCRLKHTVMNQTEHKRYSAEKRQKYRDKSLWYRRDERDKIVDVVNSIDDNEDDGNDNSTRVRFHESTKFAGKRKH